MSCKQHSSIIFDGWDWTELAQAWNVYIPSSYAGKDMYAYAEKRRLNPVSDNKVVFSKETNLEDFMSDIDWSINEFENFEDYDPILWYINLALKRGWEQGYELKSRVIARMASDVRCFAYKLSKSSHNYLAPLWEGLSRIEDDETLLRLISVHYPLLASMWD